MLINLPKQPIAGAWVTVADISGTGIGVVTSADINISNLQLLPALIEPPKIEVEFYAARPAGTGSVYTWVTFAAMSFAEKHTAEPAYPTSPTSPRMVAAHATAVLRRIILAPSLYHGVSSISGEMRFNLAVKAQGTAGDTEFSITGIRARIIYHPL